MERLNKKTWGLLDEYNRHAHTGMTPEAAKAQEDFLTHLAALEKENAELRGWKEKITREGLLGTGNRGPEVPCGEGMDHEG